MTVNKAIPRNEHPRPQLQRSDWENLNGLWAFEFDFSKSGLEQSFQKRDGFSHQITVPFCPESVLSGIEFTDFIPAVWYRRIIHIDKNKLDGRVLLHFGAVDYECQVWVNGNHAGIHKGGYTSFCFDISQLATPGENVVVVYATDDIQSGKQASGKQSSEYASHGCFYTRTTGIWQTVWLEYVPKSYIKSLRMVPDALNGCVTITAFLEDGDNAKLTFTVSENGIPIITETIGSMGQTAQCLLKINSPKLWCPDNPYLYDLEIVLEKNAQTDVVQSYFGLRTLEWKNHKFYLNGKPFFQRLILDQGFYPDGIYTAPNDDALIQDITLAKELGFNGARMHEKVFEERYLYHADKIGYMLWGEFGNWGLDITTAEGLEIFQPQWIEVLARDFNHPAIIGWCPFNETFDLPFDKPRRAQDDSILYNIYLLTKAIDPTRPVIDTSGFYHVKTDLYDLHDYEQYPHVFSKRYEHLMPGESCYDENDNRQHYDGKQPLFMSEYGGTFWSPDTDHQEYTGQDTGWSRWENPKSEQEVCDRYAGLTSVLLKSMAFCGFCYTQLTDVEQELNGLYTYDRQQKFSVDVYRRIRETNLQPAAVEDDS